MVKQISTKQVYKNQWITVREDEIEFANGRRGIYGVIEKNDAALVIPFDGTHLHLVEQYRYPVEKRSLEFVQGAHEDDNSIDPSDLAKEELEEELGLVAGTLEKIGFYYAEAGLSNVGMHIFFATELSQGSTNPDLSEADLIHHKLTIEEVEKAIADGKITDAQTIAAFGLLKAKGIF